MEIAGRYELKIGIQTWGSDGDIRPFLALAGGLVNAGHQVTLVVTSVDNKDYTSYAREMGFSILHVAGHSYDESTLKRFSRRIHLSRNPAIQIKVLLKYFFNPLIEEMYDASKSLCAGNDLIIGHFLLYPIQTAAEKSGKPYAAVTLNHSGIFSMHSIIFGVPNFGKWMNPIWWKIFNILLDKMVLPELNDLRRREGLKPAKNIIDTILTSTRLNLLAVSSAICSHKPDWPDYLKITGFFDIPVEAENWDMPDSLREFLAAGERPVFITLGSMISLDTSPERITQTLVDAALSAGCRAIVQSRWNELPDFPDHESIYKLQKAPHHLIFPHCAAVVHHGGAGTTHSATRCGCPSIIVEHFADQGFFAHELKKLGIAPGVLHRRNLTSARLARAINIVLNSPGMKMKAEKLGAIMLREDGVKTAVGLIDEKFAMLKTR